MMMVMKMVVLRLLKRFVITFEAFEEPRFLLPTFFSDRFLRRRLQGLHQSREFAQQVEHSLSGESEQLLQLLEGVES